ncbi:pentapeptide repeat-containing protein [Erwinia pyrifoliae]|uniref:pentapeptide repeat-containing protein n=1 Tax=Erwinia pyrifoliae TaxID=79967 RepID=UPI002202E890|nr:pentapeptide repeat-containing protein [Erwinia pyrifoliae]UWS29237.1 pentapeptide repeat-containing protein [Erwinia pyrifoliae]UXK12230.1 pentapeptide repeat-containing protein [Erwinia pyrifoliae]
MSNIRHFGLIDGPSGRRGELQVNGGNIHYLYQIAGSDPDSRTLEMLTNAGVLHKDIIIREFGTLNENVITKKIVNEKVDAFNKKVHTFNKKKKNEPSKMEMEMEMESSVHEALSTLKSDSFINEWLCSGYSMKEEHENCIYILGRYINFRYSDLSGKKLERIDFFDYDLTGSSFDNCEIYKCDFSEADIEGLTMHNTTLDECNGTKDVNGSVARLDCPYASRRSYRIFGLPLCQ